jgi:hypothetical protein
VVERPVPYFSYPTCRMAAHVLAATAPDLG